MKTKTFLAVLLAVTMVFCLCGCGGGETISDEDTVSTSTTTVTENTTTTTTATTTEATTTTTTIAKPTTTTKKATATTIKKTTTEKTTTTTKKDTSTTTAKQVGWIDGVVQAADPETGISWDGKSPIVYTYEDGTTGTTPKDGALYEVVPGIIASYVEFIGGSDDGICNDCGKVMGDGSNGTCVVHLLANNCDLCGAIDILGKCHTCKK